MAKVGICPNCYNVVEITKRGVFLTCESCGETVPTGHAIMYLNDICADKAAVKNVIDMCLKFEEEGRIEVALEILENLKNAHPHDEDVSFTRLRISGYDPTILREHLNTFAKIETKPAHAKEVIERAISREESLTMLPLLQAYVNNKTTGREKTEYTEKIALLKAEYATYSHSSGIATMYILYCLGILINVGMFVAFIFMPTLFYVNVAICLGGFAVEIFLLFWHNKSHGNRIGYAGIEKLLLVIYLCTIPLAIAGAIIGALV